LTRWIAEADVAPAEEHLLVCEERRQRLAAWDEYVKAMREATERIGKTTARRADDKRRSSARRG